MRLNYSDDEDYSGQFALWNANINRHLLGKKGQFWLTQLRDALLALPTKRLIARSLADDNGEVCAIGALVVAQGKATVDELSGLDEHEDSADYAKSLGVPYLTAWAVVAENDLSLDNCTPEQRYERMLTWVQARLNKKPIPYYG